jgi:glycerol kinase
MAHQTHDLMTAFASEGAEWGILKVDGGMVANGWIAQDLADVTGLTVERPDSLRRRRSARPCLRV